MKNLTLKNLWFLGLAFIVIGVIFLKIENTFFGQLDENNILRESLFLPLGWVAIIAGICVFSVFAIIGIYKLCLQKGNPPDYEKD